MVENESKMKNLKRFKKIKNDVGGDGTRR